MQYTGIIQINGVKGYQQVCLLWTPLHFNPVKSLNSLLERKLELATFSSCFYFYLSHQARTEN